MATFVQHESALCGQVDVLWPSNSWRFHARQISAPATLLRLCLLCFRTRHKAMNLHGSNPGEIQRQTFPEKGCAFKGAGLARNAARPIPQNRKQVKVSAERVARSSAWVELVVDGRAEKPVARSRHCKDIS